jgi:hypothetical protein
MKNILYLWFKALGEKAHEDPKIAELFNIELYQCKEQ